MKRIILKGRGLVKGVAKGEALVTSQKFGFWGGVNPKTGEIIDERHELFGKNLASKVFVFPEGRGSTVGAAVILETVRCGKHPIAFVNRITEPILASGSILAQKFYGVKIPIVDQLNLDPTKVIRNGDLVKVDGSRGIVEIIRKET